MVLIKYMQPAHRSSCFVQPRVPRPWHRCSVARGVVGGATSQDSKTSSQDSCNSALPLLAQGRLGFQDTSQEICQQGHGAEHVVLPSYPSLSARCDSGVFAVIKETMPARPRDRLLDFALLQDVRSRQSLACVVVWTLEREVHLMPRAWLALAAGGPGQHESFKANLLSTW